MHAPKRRLSRRSLFVGAGAAGTVAATAALLPTQPGKTEVAAEPPPERGGGYRLSEHVKRYYKSTLV
jgi:hypothetical protein